MILRRGTNASAGPASPDDVTCYHPSRDFAREVQFQYGVTVAFPDGPQIGGPKTQRSTSKLPDSHEIRWTVLIASGRLHESFGLV